MRLLPCSTVRVVNGSRVLPLSRAWHALAHATRAAIPLRRPVGGDRYIARPPRDHAPSLCTGHYHGDRASRSVWCSHDGVHLRSEIKSADETDCRLRSALERGKKSQKPLLGIVCLLTSRVLISVRCWGDCDTRTPLLPWPMPSYTIG